MAVPVVYVAGGAARFRCPGCGENHRVWIRVKPDQHPSWEWNGNLEKPTFTPSILISGWLSETLGVGVCHSYVTDGQIKFLNDSTHALAGQTVSLPPWNFHERIGEDLDD